MRSWFPPFANCAKDGAPSVLFVPAKSKAWATSQFNAHVCKPVDSSQNALRIVREATENK
jgi:hypothetical protein